MLLSIRMTFIPCSKTISNSDESVYLSIPEIQKLPIHFSISLEIRFVPLMVHSLLVWENPAVKTVLCVLNGYVTNRFKKEIQESVPVNILVQIRLTENVLTPIPTRISGIVPVFREIPNTGTICINTEYLLKEPSIFLKMLSLWMICVLPTFQPSKRICSSQAALSLSVLFLQNLCASLNFITVYENLSNLPVKYWNLYLSKTDFFNRSFCAVKIFFLRLSL